MYKLDAGAPKIQELPKASFIPDETTDHLCRLPVELFVKVISKLDPFSKQAAVAVNLPFKKWVLDTTRREEAQRLTNLISAISNHLKLKDRYIQEINLCEHLLLKKDLPSTNLIDMKIYLNDVKHTLAEGLVTVDETDIEKLKILFSNHEHPFGFDDFFVLSSIYKYLKSNWRVNSASLLENHRLLMEILRKSDSYRYPNLLEALMGTLWSLDRKDQAYEVSKWLDQEESQLVLMRLQSSNHNTGQVIEAARNLGPKKYQKLIDIAEDWIEDGHPRKAMKIARLITTCPLGSRLSKSYFLHNFIHYLLAHNRLEEALEVAGWMIEMGKRGASKKNDDHVTYFSFTSIVRKLIKEGDVERAIWLIKQIPASKIPARRIDARTDVVQSVFVWLQKDHYSEQELNLLTKLANLIPNRKIRKKTLKNLKSAVTP